MTHLEHAKVWREAARVIAGMNPLGTAQAQQLGGAQSQAYGGGMMGPVYSNEQVATFRAYDAAALVLSVIAKEYEKGGVERR